MKFIPVYIQNELLEEQLLYQMLMYLPLESLAIEEGMTIGALYEMLLEEAKGRPDGMLPLIGLILGNREELRGSRIEHMSWKDYDSNGLPDYPPNGLMACMIINPTANSLFVVFRGTPKGAWMDNAKMLIGDPSYGSPFTDQEGHTWNYFSPMQAAAMHYIESLLKRYGEHWEGFDCHYVIGHSKGGNQAQLGGLLYGGYFDAAISMDGPGVSAATENELKMNLGEERFAEAVTRLYAVNASNDYIHGLGIQLISDCNTIWFQEYDSGLPFLGSHSIMAFIDPQTGILAPFVIEPGPAVPFISKLSAVGMALPLDERNAVFMALMGFAQIFLAKSAPVNPKDEDWIRFLADFDNGMIKALGIILGVMINTKVGKAFLAYLNKLGVKEAIGQFFDNGITWYGDLPLSEQLKVAKGIAVALLLKVILIAVISQVSTMAEILQLLREMLKGIQSLGTSLMALYAQMIDGVLKGYMISTNQISEIISG